MRAKKEIEIDGRGLSWRDIKSVFATTVRLKLNSRSVRQIQRAHSTVARAIEKGESIYGVTTGFGRLAGTAIAADRRLELQRRLILSHAVGMGRELSIPETRIMMLFKINSLAKGYSGVSLEMIRCLMQMIEQGFYPVIPEQGSAGASGDLAPLAHIGLAMLGLGSAFYKAKRCSAAQGLRRANLKPYAFGPKEALSLINGTQFMAAVLAGVLARTEALLKASDIAGAMTLEALKGSLKPFQPKVASVRPHPGHRVVSDNFQKLMRASEVLESHRDCGKVQDAYSVRCIPQVHGTVRDAFDFARETLLREVNSASDNPLVFSEANEIVSAGNFHGQALAQAADTLGVALTTLGNISERRIERLTNPDLNELPAFLVRDGGLNSGMMALQIEATALAAENRSLAYPASVTSLPTGAAKEDHVSMGPISVRHCRAIAENVRLILAIETLCAAQALEFLKPLKPGRGVFAAYQCVRRYVAPLARDRYLKPDVEAVVEILPTEFVEAVEAKVGALR